MARILQVTEDTLSEAAAVLRQGGLVAFPTETVYGLGANALDAEAVARIFAAKGRPATNPVIVHVSSSDDLANLADIGGSTAAPLQMLMDEFWPGPLTLVLPRKSIVPDIVTAGGPTVAVRMPNHPMALALLRAAGVPLAAPSANRSEQLSPTRAEHVAESLGEDVDMVLDGGTTEVGLESTVIDLTEWPPRLLRPGMVTAAQIEAVLGVALAVKSDTHGPARAPGQMARHYAPDTPLHLVSDIWAEAANTPNAAVLAYTPPTNPPPAHLRAAAVLRREPRAYAAALYETLHRLDSLGASVLLVEAPPDTDDWLALRDRLQRAATSPP
jgi:L-threonylcarbamoyladenylate synthase